MNKLQSWKEVLNEDNVKLVAELVKSGKNITQAVKTLCEDKSIEYVDTLRRRFSDKLAELGANENRREVPIELSEEYKEAVNRIPKKSKYYLISWAQAETPIHQQFWENMKAYADYLDAEILIQSARYKSPTSLEASERIKEKERNKNVWAPELREYLYASRIDLGESLSVLFDVKVQPTAILPLSGLNGFTAEKSAILPHPKVQMESLPILEGYNHKLLYSTGAVTIPNYTDTKAGKKGDFHHQIGFVIAEQDEDIFHLRHVQAEDDSGAFNDLCFRVDRGKVNNKFNSERHVIVFGDLHIGSHCNKSVAASCKLARKLNAGNVILHDVMDSKSINHHEEKDPFKLLQKEEDGTGNLEKEIKYTLECLENLTIALPNTTLHNIESNHNNFVDRFLKDVDWRKVPNKKMYLKLANIVAEGKAPKGIFNYLIKESFGDGIKTYAYGDSLRLNNWELALHGDMGTNGSRGGIKQFKNLSTKTVTGHSHTPRREDGSIVVGTLTKLRLGYNVSLSSWLNGVVVIYPNGKATNVNIINGKFTTLF